MLIRDHYLGMLALLEADTALRVEDSAQLDAEGQLLRTQYAILYPTGPDDLDDARFTKRQDLESQATFTYTLKAVAVTAIGCADVADHIIAAAVGKTPTVTGRRMDPVAYDSMSDVRPDFSATPPLYYSEITLTVISRRA